MNVIFERPQTFFAPILCVAHRDRLMTIPRTVSRDVKKTDKSYENWWQGQQKNDQPAGTRRGLTPAPKNGAHLRWLGLWFDTCRDWRKKKEIFQIVADKGGHILKLLVRLNHRDWTSLPRLTVHIWSNPLDDAILIRWIFSSALPAISIL